eukprot:8090969-Pyramimonas_sp.AAC.1
MRGEGIYLRGAPPLAPHSPRRSSLPGAPPLVLDVSVRREHLAKHARSRRSQRTPITEGECRECTRSGHQSQKGREAARCGHHVRHGQAARAVRRRLALATPLLFALRLLAAVRRHIEHLLPPHALAQLVRPLPEEADGDDDERRRRLHLLRLLF